MTLLHQQQRMFLSTVVENMPAVVSTALGKMLCIATWLMFVGCLCVF
jgi:hypothetical protein